MRTLLVAAALAAGLITAGPSWAEHGHPHAAHAWARATPPTAKVGAVYVALYAGPGGDRLVAVSSSAAERAEVHETRMKDGVMTMTSLDGVDIPDGTRVVLEPGGVHIMLIGLTAPLKQGESIPLTLTFESIGDLTVDVDVRGPGAKTSGHEHGGHGHGEHEHGDHSTHGHDHGSGHGTSE